VICILEHIYIICKDRTILWVLIVFFLRMDLLYQNITAMPLHLSVFWQTWVLAVSQQIVVCMIQWHLTWTLLNPDRFYVDSFYLHRLTFNVFYMTWTWHKFVGKFPAYPSLPWWSKFLPQISYGESRISWKCFVGTTMQVVQFLSPYPNHWLQDEKQRSSEPLNNITYTHR